MHSVSWSMASVASVCLIYNRIYRYPLVFLWSDDGIYLHLSTTFGWSQRDRINMTGSVFFFCDSTSWLLRLTYSNVLSLLRGPLGRWFASRTRTCWSRLPSDWNPRSLFRTQIMTCYSGPTLVMACLLQRSKVLVVFHQQSIRAQQRPVGSKHWNSLGQGGPSANRTCILDTTRQIHRCMF